MENQAERKFSVGICATCAISRHPMMPTRRTGDSGGVVAMA